MDYQKVPQEINNIVGDNVKRLAQLFPSAVKDGQIDFQALKEELGQFEEVGKEKYELTWSGKQKAKEKAKEDIFNRTLKFIEEDSKNPETTENLYIEGDNLEVLKLLRQNYYGAIKMIYIDPPYNTGNDFVYNDNFAMSSKESDIAEGTRDEEGNPLQKNQRSSNRFHANWLNMMYPRLKVAKELLTDEGVIFISIDDNEQCNLKKICDEIFEENNFVTTLHVELSATQGMKVKAAKEGNIVKNAEYILVYSKNDRKNIAENLLYDYRPDYDEHYSKYLNDDMTISNLKDEFSKSNPSERIESLSEMYKKNDTFKEYVHENTNRICADDKITGFDISNFDVGKASKVIREGREYYLYSNGNKLRQLLILKNSFGKCDDFTKSYGLRKIRGDWWKEFYKDMGNVSKEGDMKFANGKKPVRLLKQLVKMVTSNNDIILDFFSGSGTTAHAIMEANSEDLNNRRFIMVQVAEDIKESEESYGFLEQAGKPLNICEIGKERIRRAGEKIKQEIEAANEQLMIAEEPKKVPDIGFKVFRTADTNIKWNLNDALGQIDTGAMVHTPDLADFTMGFTDIDVVYEVMLRQKDVPLSSTLETLIDIGSRTYLYGSTYLVCLETEITEELIGKLAALDPLPIKFVFRDSAFKDDINLKDETFRRLKNLIERNSGLEKKSYTAEFI